MKAIRDRSGTIPVLVVPEADNPDILFSLLKAGASDFITAPLRAVNVLPRVWRLLEPHSPEETVRQTLKEKVGLKQLIGESPAFLSQVRKVPIVARYDASVLIMGETGTGKEMCARAVHHLSPRAHKPFVPLNCGAIPVGLAENELFGHAKGAFTGASTAQPGIIAEADGGTIFLDEIDSLPVLTQVKLLRFLQEKEYRPLGSSKARHADIRVIAATNTDVKAAVKEGKLRQDLYYRLNVVPIVLPPLRERQEDIPLLARHFLEKYSRQFNKAQPDLSPDAMRVLLSHDWPGNVRELEHEIERAVVLCESPIISATALAVHEDRTEGGGESFKSAKARLVSEFEKTYIQALLLAYHGNVSRAAQAAKKHRRAFSALVRKHQIDVQRFR